jgi:hypothetical protein
MQIQHPHQKLLQARRKTDRAHRFSQTLLDHIPTIMKLILASLIASAAAFAPVSQKAASTTSLNAFEGELGTCIGKPQTIGG